MDFVGTDPSDHVVNARMEEWTATGWEMVSGTASAYVLPGDTVPRLRYVTYWRRLTSASASHDATSARSSDSAPTKQAPVEAKSVDIVLTARGVPINTINLLREITGWGLKECQQIVNSAPVTIMHGVERSHAEQLAARFRATEADVRLDPAGPYA